MSFLHKSHVILSFIILGIPWKVICQSFQKDLGFLSKYTNTIVLHQGNQHIIVTPEWQGRIMTCTATGEEGKSHGWINYSFIEEQRQDPNINPFGGIDRLWIGPLGSQFSLYYQGKKFDDKYWHVPHDFDRKPFEVIKVGKNFVQMKSAMKLSNFIGTEFSIHIERRINLISLNVINRLLEVEIPSEVDVIAFESVNTMINEGKQWDDDLGTLALWSLGQFQGNDKTAIIIPYKSEGVSKYINTYLAEIPDERISHLDSVVLFKGDGKFRSKIGIPPQVTIPLFGSIDLQNNLLIIIQFQFENDYHYFNSNLGYQENPYEGDVVSVYNNNPEYIDGEERHSFLRIGIRILNESIESSRKNGTFP